METKIPELIAKVRSGIASIHFVINGEPVASGSGFIHKNFLISNSHVFNPNYQPLPQDTLVRIRFGDTNQDKPDDLQIRYAELQLVTGSDEMANDYIVYRLPISLESHYSFEFEMTKAVEGQRVIFMGYPFGARFMASHLGYISSVYKRNHTEYYQLDASVNAGNSGGPLLNVETGKVIGIITRKETGLTSQFNELIKALNTNIEALHAAMRTGASVQITGVDPLDAMLKSQVQIQIAAREIKRSANTGIAFAFSSRALTQEISQMQ